MRKGVDPLEKNATASAWLPDLEGAGCCETWVEGWAMSCGQQAMGSWAAAYFYMYENPHSLMTLGGGTHLELNEPL